MTKAQSKLDQVLLAMESHDRALNAAKDDPRAQKRVTNEFWERQYARQHELAKEFGRLNRWKLTTTCFSFDEFGHRQPRPYQTQGSLLDHPLYYRDPYGCFAAIVGQPYGHLEEFRRGLDALTSDNLSWHVPPEPYASIWLPSATLFIVITKPRPSDGYPNANRPIVWLPEQVTPGDVLAKALAKKREPTRPSPLVTKESRASPTY